MTSTDTPHGLDAETAAAAILGFWAEAGVSFAAVDHAHDRLTAQPRRAAPPPQAQQRAAPASQAAPHSKPASAPGIDASAAAQAATTLDELAAVVAAFEGCGLRFSGAARAVFAKGAADPRLVVVGDAPDGEDERAGEPFAGAKGRLLERMLSAAGLEGQALMLNTVFWRPPGDAAPSPADQAACAPFVQRALEIAPPKAILVAGGAAVRGFLGETAPILKLHGRVFDHPIGRDGATVTAMATLDLRLLLAQPAAKALAWADVLSLAGRVEALT